MTKKSTKISVDHINALRLSMTAMPVKIKMEFTTREAIQSLETEIASLVHDRGYSLTDIAAMFTENGVPITSSTLAAYLRKPTEGVATVKMKAKSKSVIRKPALKASSGEDAVTPPLAVTLPSAVSNLTREVGEAKELDVFLEELTAEVTLPSEIEKA